MKTNPDNNPKTTHHSATPHRHPEQAKRAEVPYRPSLSDNPIKQHAQCASCL
jgi:hypothetical protein